MSTSFANKLYFTNVLSRAKSRMSMSCLFEHPVGGGISDLWNTRIPYRPRMRET